MVKTRQMLSQNSCVLRNKKIKKNSKDATKVKNIHEKIEIKNQGATIEELLKLCRPLTVRIGKCISIDSFSKKNVQDERLKPSETTSNPILPLEQSADKRIILRYSRRAENTNLAVIKQQHRKVSEPTASTLQRLIDSTFKKEAGNFKNSRQKLEHGKVILAKMSGYCAWPARIDGFTQNGRRVKCYFYGSHNTGSVNIDQVIPFEDASETIRLINLRNPRDFAKGVKEVEIELGIPDDLSVLREATAII